MKTGVWATILASGLLLVSAASSAAPFGASASVTYWRGHDSGTVAKGGGDLDINDNLGFNNDNFTAMTLSLRQPLPLVPDFKFQYFRIDQVGHGTIPANKQYDGISGNVNTDLDLSHYDVTLFYPVLDNWVHLDVGLTGKIFRGKLDVRNDKGQASNTEINKALPMLYGSARFEIPTTGLSVGAEGNLVAYNGNSAYDVSAYLDYRIVVLDLRAGYRKLSFNVSDVSGINADVSISGPFATVGVAF